MGGSIPQPSNNILIEYKIKKGVEKIVSAMLLPRGIAAYLELQKLDTKKMFYNKIRLKNLLSHFFQ